MTFRDLYNLITKIEFEEFHHEDESYCTYRRMPNDYVCNISKRKRYFYPSSFYYEFQLYKLNSEKYKLYITFFPSKDQMDSIQFEFSIYCEKEIPKGHKYINERYNINYNLDDAIPILAKKSSFPDICWREDNKYKFELEHPQKYFVILFRELFGVSLPNGLGY